VPGNRIVKIRNPDGQFRTTENIKMHLKDSDDGELQLCMLIYMKI
jgi:hypothetical protein